MRTRTLESVPVRRWFDRTFSLGVSPNEAAALIERLRGTANRLEEAIVALPVPVRIHRPEGRWSAQEHAGHLLDLEALWEQRLDDFDAGREMLHPADLDNRKTHEAGHNEQPAADIVAGFRRARSAILERLAKMTGAELARVALHPRLRQPMSVVDLCFFVAEHDDHHLDTIAEIATALSAAPVYALDLMNTVEAVVPRLVAMEDERTTAKPSPEKWSPREIVGHLIDSASNNHQRFVRAQFQDSLVFAGYAQDDWVASQRYQDAPWHDLVTLWASYNRHLARVMRTMPEPIRLKAHTRHNLDQVAFRPVPPDATATLDYFMADYVDHLHHHLRQLGLENPV